MTQLSDNKRDAILDAGARMFLSNGYSAVTMDAIAEAAPVSKPTLYNYYAGKPALFEAVIMRLCERLLQALDQIKADATDLKSGLTLIAQACVELVYAPESLQLLRVIIAEQSHFPELGKFAYRACADPVLNQIANFLRKVEREPDVEFDNVVESARLLLSMLMGDGHLRCLTGIQAPLNRDERDALVTQVVAIYLRAHHVQL